MQLLFATNNAHKLLEAREILTPLGIEVLALSDVEFTGEIPETQPTIKGNAWQKANFISSTLGMACFADDTGLEVDALDGKPGVYSARYAGANASSKQNVSKLLTALNGVDNRSARFLTVVAFVDPLRMNTHFFEGEVIGLIGDEPKGDLGFGYDPIFYPEGHSLSFAEMLPDQKHSMSHRGRALRAMSLWLKEAYSAI